MSINQCDIKQEVGKLLSLSTLNYGRNLFDDDDSLLCALVRYDVEHVVTANNAVLHLCIASYVRILSLDSADGASNLYGLQRCHAERIFMRRYEVWG